MVVDAELSAAQHRGRRTFAEKHLSQLSLGDPSYNAFQEAQQQQQRQRLGTHQHHASPASVRSGTEPARRRRPRGPGTEFAAVIEKNGFPAEASHRSGCMDGTRESLYQYDTAHLHTHRKMVSQEPDMSGSGGEALQLFRPPWQDIWGTAAPSRFTQHRVAPPASAPEMDLDSSAGPTVRRRSGVELDMASLEATDVEALFEKRAAIADRVQLLQKLYEHELAAMEAIDAAIAATESAAGERPPPSPPVGGRRRRARRSEIRHEEYHREESQRRRQPWELANLDGDMMHHGEQDASVRHPAGASAVPRPRRGSPVPHPPLVGNWGYDDDSLAPLPRHSTAAVAETYAIRRTGSATFHVEASAAAHPDPNGAWSRRFPNAWSSAEKPEEEMEMSATAVPRPLLRANAVTMQRSAGALPQRQYKPPEREREVQRGDLVKQKQAPQSSREERLDLTNSVAAAPQQKNVATLRDLWKSLNMSSSPNPS